MKGGGWLITALGWVLQSGIAQADESPGCRDNWCGLGGCRGAAPYRDGRESARRGLSLVPLLGQSAVCLTQ